jgi:hypothetical protein
VDLSAKEITDETLPQVIDVLKTMPNLVVLDISGNAITDPAPFSELINLTMLYIGSNQIIDISPVATMVNLTELYIEENPLTNIEALATLTNLATLSLTPENIEGLIPENVPADTKDELSRAAQNKAAKAKKFYVDKAKAQKKVARAAARAADADSAADAPGFDFDTTSDDHLTKHLDE